MFSVRTSSCHHLAQGRGSICLVTRATRPCTPTEVLQNSMCLLCHRQFMKVLFGCAPGPKCPEPHCRRGSQVSSPQSISISPRAPPISPSAACSQLFGQPVSRYHSLCNQSVLFHSSFLFFLCLLLSLLFLFLLNEKSFTDGSDCKNFICYL